MKKKTFIACILVGYLFTASLCQASWLIYHKPEYKGKVIDAETKEPIEGVVVAVYYMTNTYNLAGGSTNVINTRETLTDKNGEFTIPSYTTIFSPFTTSDAADFIIYKPGYGGYPYGAGLCKSPEEYFSIETLGLQGECMDGGILHKFIYGIIELPKLKTRLERERAMPSTPLITGSEEFPLLYKVINEERKRLGLGEIK